MIDHSFIGNAPKLQKYNRPLSLYISFITMIVAFSSVTYPEMIILAAIFTFITFLLEFFRKEYHTITIRKDDWKQMTDEDGDKCLYYEIGKYKQMPLIQIRRKTENGTVTVCALTSFNEETGMVSIWINGHDNCFDVIATISGPMPK